MSETTTALSDSASSPKLDNLRYGQPSLARRLLTYLASDKATDKDQQAAELVSSLCSEEDREAVLARLYELRADDGSLLADFLLALAEERPRREEQDAHMEKVAELLRGENTDGGEISSKDTDESEDDGESSDESESEVSDGGREFSSLSNECVHQLVELYQKGFMPALDYLCSQLEPWDLSDDSDYYTKLLDILLQPETAVSEECCLLLGRCCLYGSLKSEENIRTAFERLLPFGEQGSWDCLDMACSLGEIWQQLLTLEKSEYVTDLVRQAADNGSAPAMHRNGEWSDLSWQAYPGEMANSLYWYSCACGAGDLMSGLHWAQIVLKWTLDGREGRALATAEKLIEVGCRYQDSFAKVLQAKLRLYSADPAVQREAVHMLQDVRSSEPGPYLSYVQAMLTSSEDMTFLAELMDSVNDRTFVLSTWKKERVRMLNGLWLWKQGDRDGARSIFAELVKDDHRATLQLHAELATVSMWDNPENNPEDLAEAMLAIAAGLASNNSRCRILSFIQVWDNPACREALNILDISQENLMREAHRVTLDSDSLGMAFTGCQPFLSEDGDQWKTSCRSSSGRKFSCPEDAIAQDFFDSGHLAFMRMETITFRYLSRMFARAGSIPLHQAIARACARAVGHSGSTCSAMAAFCLDCANNICSSMVLDAFRKCRL